MRFLFTIALFTSSLFAQQSPFMVIGGNGPPGTVSTTQFGQVYVDFSTTPYNMYTCFATNSVNCNAVGTGNYVYTGTISPLQGILSARPSVCIPGLTPAFYQALDQPASSQLSLCTSPNTWTNLSAGGSGTVTSVAISMPGIFSVSGSPITTNGTFNVTLLSQSPNLFWMSPNGTSGPPVFRSAVLADLPSIGNNTVYGNVSGVLAVPSALSTIQLTTLCNVFTSSLSGCVPGSGGGTSNFLRADGTWTTPSGGGTVTSFSAGNLSPLFTSSVANLTTTPALTFSLTNVTGPAWFGQPSSGSSSPAYQTSAIPCGLLPALTGDTTTSAGSCATTTSKINGVAFAGNNGDIVEFGSGNTPVDTGKSMSNVVKRSIGAGFDGSGSALTSGSTATVYFTVPFTCTIVAWNITVDTGTITFDIWKIATGTAIPTSSNSITASALPAISTGTAIHSTTLTGWTTSVNVNDIFGVNINTVASATKASLIIECDQ